MSVFRHYLSRLAQKLHERRGRTAFGDCVKKVSVNVREVAEARLAQPHRLFQHRVEHRAEITGRGIDDLQYLGGRGLLLQGLARLGNEPRVLHRNHRLRGEIL